MGGRRRRGAGLAREKTARNGTCEGEDGEERDLRGISHPKKENKAKTSQEWSVL